MPEGDMSTTPDLGWSGTIGLTLIVVLLVAGIVVYHIWMDAVLRRQREASGELPPARRAARVPRREPVGPRRP
jgi:hypothetical protein